MKYFIKLKIKATTPQLLRHSLWLSHLLFTRARLFVEGNLLHCKPWWWLLKVGLWWWKSLLELHRLWWWLLQKLLNHLLIELRWRWLLLRRWLVIRRGYLLRWLLQRCGSDSIRSSLRQLQLHLVVRDAGRWTLIGGERTPVGIMTLTTTLETRDKLQRSFTKRNEGRSRTRHGTNRSDDVGGVDVLRGRVRRDYLL